jgi:crotonobetainyl-CoA:carnitine CoA-transferase CaiB-like acyl-CoA transferase
MTGVYATTAILAALHERQRTGTGRHIDASLFDVQVAMLANQASNQLIGGKTPKRMGNAHPNIVPYQVFPTANGHMVLAIGNDGQFARFCEQAGHPDVAQDDRFATNPQRVKHRSTLVPLIAQWALQRTTTDWVKRLENAAVPCSPILSVAEVLAHPQTLARDMVVGGQEGVPPMVAQPVLINGQRPVAQAAPPGLGQHGAQWLDQP